MLYCLAHQQNLYDRPPGEAMAIFTSTAAQYMPMLMMDVLSFHLRINRVIKDIPTWSTDALKKTGTATVARGPVGAAYMVFEYNQNHDLHHEDCEDCAQFGKKHKRHRNMTRPPGILPELLD